MSGHGHGHGHGGHHGHHGHGHGNHGDGHAHHHHHHGADVDPTRWDDPEKAAKMLEAENRQDWQKPEEIIQRLGVKATDVVADVGAGTGFLSSRLARHAAAVFACDPEPNMVEFLRKRFEREGLGNARPVLASKDDAALPERCDLIVSVNVYHHIFQRERYFTGLREKYLKPGGRLAIVDFKKGEWPIGHPPQHMLVEADAIAAELSAAGLRLLERAPEDFMPYHFLLVFGCYI
eukprot:tig00000391_g24865.t1